VQIYEGSTITGEIVFTLTSLVWLILTPLSPELSLWSPCDKIPSTQMHPDEKYTAIKAESRGYSNHNCMVEPLTAELGL
jgi:hypothetical protein